MPKAGSHVETDLLLCCARTRMDTANADRLENLLRQDIDWSYAIQIAHRNGVTPLLYWHLKDHFREAVPETALNYLSRSFHMNALKNDILSRELLRLLALFKAHDIPAVSFKGPILAVTVYNNLALRQFSDLDILVHKRDVLKAKSLLLSDRYRPYTQMTEAQEKAHFRDFHAYTMKRDDGRVDVDLHWKFTARGAFSSFALDLEALWERLEPAYLGESRILNLPPEELLLVLCVHGAKEAWSNLKMICDIGELLREYPDMDWERVVNEARRLRSERILFLGLLLVNELLDIALPEDVSQSVHSDTMIGQVAARVFQRLFSERPEVVNTVETYTLCLRLSESRRDKVSSTLHFLSKGLRPNERDWAFWALPKRLSFFYYVLRPIRLVQEYGRSLWQYLLRRLPGSRNDSV